VAERGKISGLQIKAGLFTIFAGEPFVMGTEYNLLWDACGIALLLLLFSVHRWAKRKGIFVAALWNLTGVVLHELAHLLAGMLFRAEPAGFSIVPRRGDTGWRLGQVTFRNINAFNAVPVALAPLGLAFAAYITWESWPLWFEPAFSSTIMLYAVMFVLLYNSAPSMQDLRVACNWKSLLLYGAAIAAICWFLYVC
jgi:hypothetical protein